ncbi:hypothetical protein EYF80_027278 [Liparis tanakae]|uniref:Uncharacterized protein n=1 Tax=Liparis tanakae TaxID=230148 RepID=A0A4Z2HB35_9TELE|nr:hypothetical protein EYF80_027278 [Liparis tanakae]
MSPSLTGSLVPADSQHTALLLVGQRPCPVDRMNEGVDHPPHVGSERVKGGPRGPRAFEMSVLVALGTQQPLLHHGDVQEGCDDSELREQGPLQLLVMHHQQALSELQPAERVGRPPGGVA